MNRNHKGFRVLCVGDSTTWGDKVPLSAIYAQQLNTCFNQKAQVISCGVMGYSMFQCKQQIKHELLKWKPDLITVASNYNDRRYLYHPSFAEEPNIFEQIYLRYYVIDLLTRYSRMFHQIIYYMIYNRVEENNYTKPPLDELECRQPLNQYKNNIQKICSIADVHDINLLLIGMADNFKHFKIYNKYKRAKTIKNKIKILQKARKNANAGVFGLATRKLIELIKKENIDNFNLHDLNQKYSYYESAHGGFIIADDETYRRAMKDVAQTNDVIYLNFAKYAKQDKAVRAHKKDLFIKGDECHLNKQGHSMLANAIAPYIKKSMAKNNTKR